MIASLTRHCLSPASCTVKIEFRSSTPSARLERFREWVGVDRRRSDARKGLGTVDTEDPFSLTNFGSSRRLSRAILVIHSASSGILRFSVQSALQVIGRAPLHRQRPVHGPKACAIL